MTTAPNTTASGAADRYTKKPVTIDAIRWTGKNLREVIAFTNGPPDTRTSHAGMAWDTYVDLVERDGLKIFTLEGKMSAAIGDWIIKGVKGEIYPCKDEIFEATYSPALAASAPVAPTQPETFQWPEMPPSKGQSPVLFEDGYAEGWARCNSDFRRAIQQATAQAAPVAPAPHPDLRAQVMEIITGVWDHATKIDDATDDVLDLAAAPKAGHITVKDQV